MISEHLCQPGKAFLIDLDGTILDSLTLASRTLQVTLQHFGVHVADWRTLKNQFAKSEKDVLLSQGVAEEDLPAASAKWAQVSGEYASELRYYAGMTEILQKIRQKGCPLGIVTGRSIASMQSSSLAFQAASMVDFVVREGDIPESKPHPRPFLHALERLNTLPENAVFIGDSPNDIESASRAGCYTVLVTWGVASDDRNFQFKPDWIIPPIPALNHLLFG